MSILVDMGNPITIRIIVPGVLALEVTLGARPDLRPYLDTIGVELDAEPPSSLSPRPAQGATVLPFPERRALPEAA